MNPMVPTRTTQSSAVTTPTARARRTPRRGRRARRQGRRRDCASCRGAAAARRASPFYMPRVAPPRSASREEVREEPVRPRHAGGELPEERETGVDVSALTVTCDEEAAVERLLFGVAGAEDRRVSRVPRLGVVEAALLHPAVEVGRANRV